MRVKAKDAPTLELGTPLSPQAQGACTPRPIQSPHYHRQLMSASTRPGSSSISNSLYSSTRTLEAPLLLRLPHHYGRLGDIQEADVA